MTLGLLRVLGFGGFADYKACMASHTEIDLAPFSVDSVSYSWETMFAFGCFIQAP